MLEKAREEGSNLSFQKLFLEHSTTDPPVEIHLNYHRTIAFVNTGQEPNSGVGGLSLEASVISPKVHQIPQSRLLGTEIGPPSPLKLLQIHRKLEIGVWNVATENVTFS